MPSHKGNYLEKSRGFVDKRSGTMTHYYELVDLTYTSNLLFIWEKAKSLIRSRDTPLIYYDEKNHFICFVEGKNDEDLLLEMNSDDELKYLVHNVIIAPIYFEKHYFVGEADANVCIDLYRLFKEFRRHREEVRDFY